jgi:DNA transformation protein
MEKQTEFEAFLTDHLHDLGSITIRRMFGGAGVFLDGVMFGLIADDTLYLKCDDRLRASLTDDGSEPFIYQRPSDGKSFDMGYVSMPETGMDDPDEAVGWCRQALLVALASKTQKRKSRSS